MGAASSGLAIVQCYERASALRENVKRAHRLDLLGRRSEGHGHTVKSNFVRRRSRWVRRSRCVPGDAEDQMACTLSRIGEKAHRLVAYAIAAGADDLV